MNDELLNHIQTLRESRRPFALATVIHVKGSASARAGSKAVITEEGKNLYGWVGGGCAESFVCKQSLEAMSEGRPRIITADLDDEIFGLGMPCGGIMDVYIEPMLPQKTLLISSDDALSSRVAWLAEGVGLRVVRNGQADLMWRSLSEPVGDTELSVFALLGLAGLLRDFRGLKPEAMAKAKGVHENASLEPQTHVTAPKVLIVGSSRITEELARLSTTLGFKTTIHGALTETANYPASATLIQDDIGFDKVEIDPETFVVIAAHHKGDPEVMIKALESKCAYVSLVASAKRSKIVFDHVMEQGLTASVLNRVRAPAGVELKTENPAEIALSILTEICILNGMDRLNLFGGAHA